MLNKIRKLKEKKGFTLVELIVVIAIIAILTAVLVPLINNWTQQAAYTTLNDGAQTISNSVNEAISKIVAGGSPTSATTIKGEKSAAGANKLLITVTAGSSSKTSTANGKTAVDGTTAIGNTTDDKVAQEIAKMLDATMPTTSSFTATIKDGAVTGVVYSNSKSTAPATSGITKVENFDGYKIDTDSYGAVGVTGQYITTSTS